MKHAVYISEPTMVDPSLVKRKLGDRYSIVPGSLGFDDSLQYEYETLVIRSGTRVTNQIKTYFPNLKHIIRIGTGLDNIDLSFCKSQGIAVYNAAGANADAVSEYVMGIILYVTRNLHKLSGQDLLDWNRYKFVGTSMSGQTIGLLGFGNIGKLLFKKFSGFSYKDFLVYDPYIDAANVPDGVTVVNTIDELIKRSTIVSLHLPLTDETRNCIDKRRLQLLQTNAILINASRGGIVDESAVLKLLDNSASFTYIADTVENEPHGNKALFSHERIIVTPHIASLTVESEKQMIDVALDHFLTKHEVMI